MGSTPTSSARYTATTSEAVFCIHSPLGGESRKRPRFLGGVQGRDQGACGSCSRRGDPCGRPCWPIPTRYITRRRATTRVAPTKTQGTRTSCRSSLGTSAQVGPSGERASRPLCAPLGAQGGQTSNPIPMRSRKSTEVQFLVRLQEAQPVGCKEGETPSLRGAVTDRHGCTPCGRQNRKGPTWCSVTVR